MRDMAFHKKAGLKMEDMVRSRWVYRKLRNFRAGIEADISCLTRLWSGLLHPARPHPLQGLRLVLGGRLNLGLFARLTPPDPAHRSPSMACRQARPIPYVRMTIADTLGRI